jgi:mRNA-degrading endonuclease RelE of RelBE toxin-antitoxin system
MSYKITVLNVFNRQAKRLIKKYPSLKTELAELINTLTDNPNQGAFIGTNCFKIRLSISSKGKGKSGGARIITHIHFSEDTVILMNIYDKAEQSTITDTAIKELLKYIYN